MTTYYVSVNGDDNNDGLSWGTALSTYKKAYDISAEGDIIEFGEGNFSGFYDRDSLTTDAAGDSTYMTILCNKGHTIKGQKSGKTRLIFDFKGKAGTYSDRLYVITGSAKLTTFIDVRFEIKNSEAGEGDNIFVGGKEKANFYNCSIHYDENCGDIYLAYWYCEARFYNCFIMFEGTGVIGASFRGGIAIYNSVYDASMSTNGATIENSISVVKGDYNNRFKLLNQDNNLYGVYSGNYAWERGKYLLQKTDGYYTVDSDNNFILISNSLPDETLFKEQGLEQISAEFLKNNVLDISSIVVWGNEPICSVTYVPKSQTVITSGDINLTTVENLKAVNLSASDDIKVLLSVDSGVTWTNVEETVNLVDISTKGLTANELEAITETQWNTLIKDKWKLRFAYYLPDGTAWTDSISFTADFLGVWQKATHNTDYQYYYDGKLNVKFFSNGDYKINYNN